jgi:hypothetical protein
MTVATATASILRLHYSRSLRGLEKVDSQMAETPMFGGKNQLSRTTRWIILVNRV